ncbi:unnamed protein product [Jaminaea pallidilutea]
MPSVDIDLTSLYHQGSLCFTATAHQSPAWFCPLEIDDDESDSILHDGNRDSDYDGKASDSIGSAGFSPSSSLQAGGFSVTADTSLKPPSSERADAHVENPLNRRCVSWRDRYPIAARHQDELIRQRV